MIRSAVRIAAPLATAALAISLFIPRAYGDIIPADRRTDWQPGIEGGIPSRTTICANVKTQHGAIGDGITDDSQAFQAAIASCPEGQVVLIPSGTYRLNDSLLVEKGIVLRGEGPSNTKLLFYGAAATSDRGYIHLGDLWDNNSNYTAVTQATKGSATLAVAATSGFSEGGYVFIDQIDDPSFVTIHGIGGTCDWCGSRNGQSRALTQMMKITGVGTNSLTVDPAPYLTYSSAFSPEIYKPLKVTAEAGIEDLYIEDASGGASRDNIRLKNCARCWVRNIESNRVQEHHILAQQCYRCEIRDSYIHDAHVFGGGQGYGILLSMATTATLVENNILYDLHCPGMIASGPSGNVMAYNYSLKTHGTQDNWSYGSFTDHAAHPHMNLFEGNVGHSFGADFYWGSASHQTVYRNHFDMADPGKTAGLQGVRVDKYNYFFNIVGNVLGAPGTQGVYEFPGAATCDVFVKAAFVLGYESSCSAATDPQVLATLLRHGNYDGITQTTQWDSTNADHTLPPSLYHSSKPAFFGCRRWPPIGSDLDPMVSRLPAQDRYEGVDPCQGDAGGTGGAAGNGAAGNGAAGNGAAGNGAAGNGAGGAGASAGNGAGGGNASVPGGSSGDDGSCGCRTVADAGMPGWVGLIALGGLAGGICRRRCKSKRNPIQG
ncbi:MAG: right-handed parallel beta-helix repeat-containing protein [Deltaproteobacteria bacterium]|nr:right-handed parallel beta-helix repeat-containing protein [Deltaproteobacteria bacterium]